MSNLILQEMAMYKYPNEKIANIIHTIVWNDCGKFNKKLCANIFIWMSARMDFIPDQAQTCVNGL